MPKARRKLPLSRNPRARAALSGALCLDGLRLGEPAMQSYVDLRDRIHAFLRCQRQGRRAQARRVFRGTYMELLGKAPAKEEEACFPLLVAHVLRRLLTAHSRVRLQLPEEAPRSGAIAIVDIDAALTVLEARDPLSVRLIELYYFAGIDPAAVCTILHLEPATAARTLRVARAWLVVHLATRQ